MTSIKLQDINENSRDYVFKFASNVMLCTIYDDTIVTVTYFLLL